MNEKKSEFIKELKSNFKSFFILICTGILLYFNFSIARYVFNTKDSKLIWLIDLGVFNIIITVVISSVLFIVYGYRTKIHIKFVNKAEKINKVSLKNGENKSVILYISLKGRVGSLSDKIEIIFPHWIDVQVKSCPFVIEDIVSNKYIIDMKKIFNKQSNVDQTEAITFDIISTSEENDVLVLPELIDLNKLKTVFHEVKIEGLHINKGG